jgi:hypothetical protein
MIFVGFAVCLGLLVYGFVPPALPIGRSHAQSGAARPLDWAA